MTDSPNHPSAGSPDATDDFVRLNDLLDGRLDDAEAEALRARIEVEPPLREMWDDLKRMQDCVRRYGPTGAALEPPSDFLSRVRAGIDAHAASGDPAAAKASTPGFSGGTPGRPAPPRGRMLRVLTVAYAAAALLVVGFTVRYALDRAGDDVLSGEEVRSVETADAPEKASEMLGGLDGETRPRRDEGAKTELAERAGDAAGGFRAPGGAVPPGLRAPSDAPAPPPPATRRPAPVEAPLPPTEPTAPAEPVPPAVDPASSPAAFEADEEDEARPDGKPAARRQGVREVVFVYAAADPARARDEIRAILTQARVAAYALPEAAGPPVPTTPAPPGSPRVDRPGSGAGETSGRAANGSPVARLYRVRAGDPYLAALRKLDSGIGTGGGAAGRPGLTAGRDAGDAAPSVVETLDEATYRKLSALVGDRTWVPPEGPWGAPKEAAEGGKKAKGKGSGGGGGTERPSPEPSARERGSRGRTAPPPAGSAAGPAPRSKEAQERVRVRIVIVPPK